MFENCRRHRRHLEIQDGCYSQAILLDISLKAVLNVFLSLHHLNCLYVMNTKWYSL